MQLIHHVHVYESMLVYAYTVMFIWTLAPKSNRAESWHWWMAVVVVTVETAVNVPTAVM